MITSPEERQRRIAHLMTLDPTTLTPEERAACQQEYDDHEEYYEHRWGTQVYEGTGHD